MNPEYSVAEQAYIAEFNQEANGYDLRTGPCCNKWIQSDPEAHRTGWVQLEELNIDDLHVDIAIFSMADEDASENTFVEEPDNDPEVAKELAKFRETFPTDAWGVELPRQPRSGAVKLHSDPFDGEELRNFNRFPGIVGAHKYVELCHPKLCTLKLATRFAESHGKHGRHKRTHIDYHRA